MSLDLCGKVEVDIEIKASAEQFYHMFKHKPHHIHSTTDKVNACNLHEGELGTVGSVFVWNYVHDGKHNVAKVIIEEIDDEKNSITMKVTEGDLADHYKNLTNIIQATPKTDGEGSIVHWTYIFEKHHAEILDPHTLLDLAQDITKDLDIHLLEAAKDPEVSLL